MNRALASLVAKRVSAPFLTTRDAGSFMNRAFTTVHGKYYHIEASNAERKHATKLTDAGSLMKRAFTTVFGKYYHIEASNAERKDATKLVVKGPDVDGILASMTVTLAVKGCSLVELHAGHAMDCSHDHVVEDTHLIKDVFYVVNRKTGKPFEDDELHSLAEALLESAKSPLKAVTLTGANKEVDDLEAHLQEHVDVPETQITVIPSKK